MASMLRRAYRASLVAVAVGLGIWGTSAQFTADLNTVITNTANTITYTHHHVYDNESHTYLVPTSDTSAHGHDDMPFVSYAEALSIGVRYRNDAKRNIDRLIGGYTQLRRALADYQWIESCSVEQGVVFSCFKIAIPNNVLEAAFLEETLSKLSNFFVWPDQTKSMNHISLRCGQGISESLR